MPRYEPALSIRDVDASLRKYLTENTNRLAWVNSSKTRNALEGIIPVQSGVPGGVVAAVGCVEPLRSAFDPRDA